MNPSPPPIQASSSSSSFPSVTLFQKIFLTEGIHSVSEASRSINGREFICLYEKDSAEIVVKQSKRSHLFLKMIVLVFAMVCGLYICSVYLNQFSVQTSQLVRTRITTRIQYPKPETFNRFFAILSIQRSGSSWFDISPPIRYPMLENMTTTNQLNGEAPLLV
ncbi:hypothetical protein DY000_02015275 [Brassica cretica]|uniref:Uncharacterized protein n=1 Tax=Brassica cretica TaxID=69181 RepID=A0ABQ7D8W5_BRACR|nr:hypothetical protein DY000_02015275 [Brassica cretica]